MTALEMAGVSLSVLPIDDEALSLLDAATAHDAAWHGFSRAAPNRKNAYTAPSPVLASASSASPASPEAGRLADMLEQVISDVLQHEELLTQLDQQTGDGDFGVTLARGGKAVRAKLGDLRNASSLADALHVLGMELQRSMGGTSGALYGVFFLRASDALRKHENADEIRWVDAFKAGTDAIGHLGGAKLGDATMMDALLPATDAFVKMSASGDWQTALAAAAEAARRSTLR